MNLKTTLPILIILIITACSNPEKQNTAVEEEKKQFDLQGHRGARGIMPENTIPGFLKALEYDVTTLELDLAVTKDSLLVVSHEPWMNELICTDSLGSDIVKESDFNIYRLTYQEIAKFDCGSKGNPRFPDQAKMNVSKPLLSDVIQEVNKYLKDNNKPPVKYNIEIKSGLRGDGVYHPRPPKFSRLVYEFIIQNMNPDLVTVQSFDFRALRYFNENYPDINLALLIENESTIQQNLDSLGFKPDIYSCYFKLLDDQKINTLQQQNIQVIPWTVNDSTDMKQLIDWGVDGIITDYPNIAKNLLTGK
ncbi:MAG: glycerophosphodiester phosphodiesterase [bacterium]|nr:glycerophosphodiester phosphodiesterase [bacterium]